MSLFTKISPTIIIDGKNLEKHISQLESLNNLNEEGQKIRDTELKSLNIGLYGEKQILFELINSNIPMYIFHDVYYEYEGLNAQIDFIIVTEYKIFVVECKNIMGNVIINNGGSFIREFNGKNEGMYSPITQNQRHIDLLVNLQKSRQSIIGKLLNYNIQDFFDSVIVFTNPKTIIKSHYAPNQIKCRSIRADAIIEYIKRTIRKTNHKIIDMESYSRFFEYHNTTNNKDYISKYDKFIIKNQTQINDVLKNTLKEYRLETSKKEGTKPYFIFTNEQLEEIITKLPKTKEQLLSIKGFGAFKVDKYGQDIINIIDKL